ncbi:MAG: hypothetical protein IPM74_11465 [Crocinitomicaceae bacterium]|nr:hypothetical protein [Crocinitomicaceae bacterium]
MQTLEIIGRRIDRFLSMIFFQPYGFNWLVALFLLGFGTVTNGQYNLEIYNLEMLQLKGPVKPSPLK